jgi:N-methylhydantoinase B
MEVAYVTDCVSFPPRGTQGGLPAARNIPFKLDRDGKETEIRPLGTITLQPGEEIGQHSTGGGGYGPAFERETERVRQDVLSGFVSFERAREVYGVAFTNEQATAELQIDAAETSRLRARHASA